MKKNFNTLFWILFCLFILKACVQDSIKSGNLNQCIEIKTKECVVIGKDYPTCEYLATLNCRENKIKGS